MRRIERVDRSANGLQAGCNEYLRRGKPQQASLLVGHLGFADADRTPAFHHASFAVNMGAFLHSAREVRILVKRDESSVFGHFGIERPIGCGVHDGLVDTAMHATEAVHVLAFDVGFNDATPFLKGEDVDIQESELRTLIDELEHFFNVFGIEFHEYLFCKRSHLWASL